MSVVYLVQNVRAFMSLAVVVRAVGGVGWVGCDSSGRVRCRCCNGYLASCLVSWNC